MSKCFFLNKRKFSFTDAFVLSLALAPVLSGCGGTQGIRDTLGLTREAPDEFSVVRRAPLEIPEGLTAASLPPPRPGALRPQESTPEEDARAILVGENGKVFAKEESASEGALLKKAGAVETDEGIRRKVDEETAQYKDRNQPVIQKITGIVKKEENNSATVVDAKAEYERLKKNAAEGKPPTEGETPYIDE